MENAQMPLLIRDRLHHLNELNLAELRSLDREHTAVLLPVGMVEVHGFHLPLGTDTYAVDALTLAASAWLLESQPDLHILLLPTLPYGVDPVDTRRPELFMAAGSLSLQRSTLKAVVTDLLRQMIGYDFVNLFPVGFHGGPEQSIVLEEVCRDLRTAYPGLVLFEPVGYVLAGAGLESTPGLATLLGRPMTAHEEISLRNSVHASMVETSMMLHLRPDLVAPGYRSLRSIEWRQVYSMPDWPGYIGAGPAHANAEFGAAVLRWRGVRSAELIRKAMQGEDLSLLPRHPTLSDAGQGEYTQSEVEARAIIAHDESRPVMYFSEEQVQQARSQGEQPADATSVSHPTKPAEKK